MSRRHIICGFVCIALFLATVFIYLPARHYPFLIYDDPDYVANNTIVQAGLTWAGIKWAFTTFAAGNWHPLTWLSFMLDCQIFGLNAGGHHLVNVFLHAANSVLLLVLLLRLTRALGPSAFVAALFAWHPLRVESVAWIAERKDVLSAFFGLLALLAYVSYTQKCSRVEGPGSRTDAVEALDSRPSTFDYSLALFFFACGLLAKPMLVTLPFVMLLLDYWPLQRAPNYELRFSHWRGLVREKWPFFVLVVASCVVTFIAQKRSTAIASLQGDPLSFRFGNAAIAYVEYLFKSVYPVNLAVFYPLPNKIPWGGVAGDILVLVLITGLVWWVRKQQPYLLVGWLWYLGMLVPVIGLVQAGSQAMADRYTYLPLIGISIGVVFGLREVARKMRETPAMIFGTASVILGGCLWMTARQLHYWKDNETLFEHTLAVTKDNPAIQCNLGAVLNEAGHPQAAIGHFREALRLRPDTAFAHDGLGYALLQTGEFQAAMEQFREALWLQPDATLAHIGLGNALLQTGHPQAAMEQFREALQQYQAVLRLHPDRVDAQYDVGMTLTRLGRPAEAIPYIERALQLRPDFPKARNSLGLALFQSGRMDEAIAQFRTAFKLEPDNAEICCNLAATFLQKGQADEAIHYYQEALKIQPNFAPAHDTLGKIFLKKGQMDEAVTEFRAALRIQPVMPSARNDLGNALINAGYVRFQKNQLSEAIADWQEGLQIEPDDVAARNYLGFACLRQGQADKAAGNFQRVLKLQPDNVDAHKYLAWILATCPDASIRNGTNALKLAQQADQLSGSNDPTILATLAAAQAEAGNSSEALATAKRSLDLATAQTNVAVANALRVQIKSYENGAPFRDSTLTNTQTAAP